PFRLGLAVALLGLMLTLGTGHGGVAGAALERLVALALGTTGSTVLGVLLTIAGALLLAGASLGASLRRTGRVMHRAQQRVRRRQPNLIGEANRIRDLRFQPVPEPPVDVKHDYPDLVTVPEPDSFHDAPTHASQEQLFEPPRPVADYELSSRQLLVRSRRGASPNRQ